MRLIVNALEVFTAERNNKQVLVVRAPAVDGRIYTAPELYFGDMSLNGDTLEFRGVGKTVKFRGAPALE